MAANSKARKEEAPQGHPRTREAQNTNPPGAMASSQLRQHEADSRSPVERTAGTPSNEVRV